MRKPARAAPARFIDDYLSYLLARASHAVYKEFERTVNAAGLSSLEWRVLATLADVDGLSVGDLARVVLAKQPTLTKLIDRMEGAGWVARAGRDGDARVTVVRATARGKRAVARLKALAKEHEREILASFGAHEVATFKAMLRSMVERSERAPPG
ncbi:MAG: MarR family transcriptional regulator [Burkholderiales bacterium]|nr:MarR family transcriptional regulator [Burkholderiales bacterium]